MLQNLYWKREGLKDAAWRLELRMQAYASRGKNSEKLLAQFIAVVQEIRAIEERMEMIERNEQGAAAYA